MTPLYVIIVRLRSTRATNIRLRSSNVSERHFWRRFFLPAPNPFAPLTFHHMKLEQQAYIKLFLHAARYVESDDVQGFLVGTTSGDRVGVILDAVPLGHHALLTPVLELAATLTEEWLKSSSKWKGADGKVDIIGYYCTGRQNGEASTLCQRAAAAIAKKTPSAPLIVIDNVDLENPENSGIKLHTYSTKAHKWTLDSSTRLEMDEVSIALGNSILKKGGQYEIVDFEQHLENPSLNCFKDIQM